MVSFSEMLLNAKQTDFEKYKDFICQFTFDIHFAGDGE